MVSVALRFTELFRSAKQASTWVTALIYRDPVFDNNQSAYAKHR